MADGTNDTSWSLNLDASELIESANKAREAIASVGEIESLSGLLSTLTSVGVVLGAVGAAVLAMKESFDLAVEAETIRAINTQFELLTHNVGISGQELKESLVESANGLIAETDLLKAANMAVVEMGSSAKDLGGIMELARKQTAIFGGDLLTNFNTINQAIASGSTRQLKHLGIIIDQKKAYEEYAKQIGVSSAELTKHGQQQAVLNAVLEQGDKALSGVNENQRIVITTWEQLKVTLKEIGETATLAFDRLAGPTVRSKLDSLSGWAKEARTWFTAHFGAGAEQAAAQTVTLADKILALKGQIIDLEQVQVRQAGGDPYLATKRAAELDRLRAKLKDYEAQLITTEATAKKLEEGQSRVPATASGAKGESDVDLKKMAADRAKYQQQIDQMRLKNLADEKAEAMSIADVNKITEDQIVAIKKHATDEIKKLDSDQTLSGARNADLKKSMIEEIEKRQEKDLEKLQKDTDAARIQSLMNFAKANDTVAASVSAVWKAKSMEAANSAKDFSQLGTNSFNAFSQNAQNSLMALGQGSESAGDAMRHFLLGALADIAQSQGAVMLASVLLNPAMGAAGAALLVLSGVLRGMAGGGGSGSSVSSAVTTSSTGASTYSGAQSTTGATSGAAPVPVTQAQQKSVNVIVQGHYFETDQTKMALVDLIRQNQDATDFKVQQVGG